MSFVISRPGHRRRSRVGGYYGNPLPQWVYLAVDDSVQPLCRLVSHCHRVAAVSKNGMRAGFNDIGISE
jgi:hypothetical protein